MAKTYKQTLKVNRETATIMQQLCENSPSEGRNIEFDESVQFDNGLVMDIQVCHGGEDSYWTQGVLYEPSETHLIEVACTDVGESFAGEYHVWYDGDEYITNVEVGD